MHYFVSVVILTLSSSILGMQKSDLIRPVTTPRETIERIGSVSLDTSPYLAALAKPIKLHLVKLLTRTLYRTMFQSTNQPIVRHTIAGAVYVKLQNNHAIVRIDPRPDDPPKEDEASLSRLITTIYNFQDLSDISRCVLPGHPGKIVLTANGREAFHAFANTALHWDLSNQNNPQLVSIFAKHTNHIRSIDVTPDGVWALTVSAGETILRDLRVHAALLNTLSS